MTVCKIQAIGLLGPMSAQDTQSQNFGFVIILLVFSYETRSCLCSDRLVLLSVHNTCMCTFLAHSKFIAFYFFKISKPAADLTRAYHSRSRIERKSGIYIVR